MYKGFLYIYSLLLIIGLSAACSNDQSKLQADVYGIIYSSNTSPKSLIQFYSKDWKETKRVPLNVGGIQQSVINNGKLYAPVLGTPTSPQNKIIEYDFKKDIVKYIKTEAFPVKLKVKDNFLYVLHNTNISSGTITKISLKTNKTIKQTVVKGTVKDIAISDNKVFVTADNVRENKQTIYILNQDLILKDDVINNKTAFTTDTAIINQKLYLMNVAKNDFSNPTDLLTIFNIKTKKIKVNKLKSPAPYQMLVTNNKLLVTHYNPPADSGNQISVIDKKTNEMNNITLKNNLFKSIVNKNSFISVDSKGTVYEYNLKNFKLKNKYKLNLKNDMVITDLFLK